jgi:two-component system NtrC family sensor kinase
MRNLLYILGFLFSLSLFSQDEKVSVITDTNFSNQWITLANDWRYQKGDNLEWAKPEFDDASWKQFSSINLNMPDSTNAIAGDNDIVWFRKRITADSSLSKTLVFEVDQQGASEIYLDGKLIYTLGTVSSNPEELENYDPRGTLLSFPQLNGKEQVLAIRYANGQYKLPKNRRYANTSGFIRFEFTGLKFANSSSVLTLTDSLISDQWLDIRNYWRYQKGDNPNWADSNFDDSSWLGHDFFNLNMRNGENAIADRGEIAWFRKRIKADSNLTKTLVLNIFQEGASEIYLDGKLIHQLGKVSSNNDEVIYNNAYKQILQLPLDKGKEQLLAVRYVNTQYKFPLYTDTNGYIRIAVTSLKNTNSTDIIKNNRLAFIKQFIDNYRITLGLAILLFIIFLSFFIFFPNEKINGYFAASILFSILFITGILWESSNSGNGFWIMFYYDTCILISGLIILYCFYKILEQPLDHVFKILIFLCLVTIGCFLLYDPNIIAPAWALLLYLATIRIGILSWNHNKIASLLFISSSCIGLLYWTLIICNDIGLTQLPIRGYIPFAFMILPIVLAIYLGYAFGKRSQDLRLNLERVQRLSKEKETILSSQKATLEKQVVERTEKLNQSLENLKATQSQLVQSEKMASLGELTAGIAHEIQNPLNFVNNFSEVSNELIDEMNEEIEKGDLEEVKAISLDIKKNLEKINHHGKRADSIVKGMLQHSRSSNGKKEPTNINALADEYLRLAYHGLRAKDKAFNSELVTDFDETIKTIDVIPQDIGRVILNLLTNAFYVVNEKQKFGLDNYRPKVSVSTKKHKDSIEIKVTDNGNGMPKSVQEKIFQPFFTTKPTGQGTGLGLSMSYDIITKRHKGELQVESTENQGTTFRLILPL